MGLYMCGASGGNCIYGYFGGLGGCIYTTIDVTGPEKLTFMIGGAGANYGTNLSGGDNAGGYNGGGRNLAGAKSNLVYVCMHIIAIKILMIYTLISLILH